MKLSELLQDGTYIAVLPIGPTEELLQGWAAEQNLALPDHLHVTVLYSRIVIPVVPSVATHTAVPTGFKKLGDCTVMTLDCKSLLDRHDQLINAGGTHDFDSYVIHITIGKDINPDSLVLPDFSLILGKEYVCGLND